MSVRTTAAIVSAAILIVSHILTAAAQGTDGPAHAIAMHGDPKYPADFNHFDYVNPNALKGGKQVSAATGTFDSLNPFILRGTPAGIGAIYDSLTVSSADEPFTQYCLLCETLEIPNDRSWVEYTMRDDAFWHDGTPVTVDDVIFTFDTLLEKGRPFYRQYYADVVEVVQTGPRKVRFNFRNGENKELPLIVGQLTVLPKHYWETRDFTKTTLEPPLGSGSYRIKDVQPGRTIVLEREPDYWAANHPTQIGFNNIDELRIEYFRDRTVSREAFKAGDIDIWVENTSKEWATGYDTPAVREGLLIKGEFVNQSTWPIQGYIFNLRRPLFQDRRVRLALTQAFDFEWTNANLFYGLYTRTDSYFDNSELTSSGLLADAGAEEREILERYRGRIPDEVFTEVYQPPRTDGSGARGIRQNLRFATGLLREAGWEIVDGVLTNVETGEPFEFELLFDSPTDERIALPFRRNLERLGVKTTIRIVDAAQYQSRVEAFDYDMISAIWGQAESPGNEQRSFWGSEAANTPGSRNWIGIADPVIDELIELVITAPDRESLVQRTRALDRVLQWGYYLIPHFRLNVNWVAYWDRYGIPETIPTSGVVIGAWWIDPTKEAALRDRKARLSN